MLENRFVSMANNFIFYIAVILYIIYYIVLSALAFIIRQVESREKI